ncbi:uncharacterized protein [Euwallacea similis]|uniref:uncharacterized protein n=1 Tax=Euwallacea similis TaxID=1736056 RepID=UPI00344B9A83
MPLKIFLGFVLCLIVGCNSHKDITSLPDTSPKEHPYVVTLKGLEYCSGILISAHHVLAPASCVCDVPKVAVLLGFEKYPYFAENRLDPNGQIIVSTEIILHEDYYKMQPHRHLNNMAIVKLPHPANLTDNVQPAKLLDPEDSFQLDGNTVKIVGWKLTTNTKLKETEARLRNQDTCANMFGQQFFRNQESCVRWFQKGHLNLLGNPVTFKGKVIGFQTATPNCKWPTLDCSQNDFVLNIAPYIDWINAHVYGHVISKIRSNELEAAAQYAHLLSVIENLKKEQLGDKASINEELNDLKLSIQKNSKQGQDIALMLNEEINGVKTEIANRDLMYNKSIYQLNEDISDSRQEFSNGLSAQENYHKNLVQRVDELDTKSPKIDEALDQIQIALNSLEVQSDLTKSSFEHLTEELKEEIKKVKRHVEDLEATFGKLKNVSQETEDRIIEVDEHIHHIHKEIDDFNPRISLIEQISDETRQRLDKQIVTVHEQYQKIQRENDLIVRTVNDCCKRNDYFYAPPVQ